ncbi:MAG: serine O-acetyltransferase [Bacteroidetes bacterium]|nr:serine O-acetyltransferase [Bacteroidota bacterium]
MILNEFSKKLIEIRKGHSSPFAVKTEAHKFINDLLQLLFPHFTEQVYYTPEEIESKIILLSRNLKNILRSLNNMDINIDNVTEKFVEKIPEINDGLWKDAEAIYDGDPAAESIDEVILAYPGFLAISIYRFAHQLYLLKVPLLPRLLSEYAHQVTGIDINPGAKIGESFFIDHGTGIVIGETAEIGNNVKIYQGVTLGAMSVEKELAKKKRHPTIGDNVIIYSQAVILGGDTRIGHDSVIGGNVWLTQSVPPHSVVYHTSEVKVRKNGKFDEAIDFVI